ncbi:MAG TPA: transporter [Caulobacter sp.]|nr:transporter [Caulobacter sp.]
MRLLGTGLIACSALAATAASGQALVDPADLRLAPVDGRLAPRIKDPGALEGWASAQEPPPLRLKGADRRSEWDVSATTRFVEQTRADAIDFQTPGLFEAEGAVVRRVGDFRVGAVGYSARTVGDQAGRGPRLGPMKWQGSAVGPIVGYDTWVAGKPATLSLRWYREIDAPGENGDTVSAAFAIRF